MATDLGASVLARLKNTAKETGRSYQLCLQLFCQEEFLRRLANSKYARNFILKGGLFLYTLTHFSSRVTMDVDLLLQKYTGTQEMIYNALKEIISVDTGNDFITFEIGPMAPIAVESKYAGIGTSLIAHIKNTRTILRIDIGVGDIVTPSSKKGFIPTQLSGFSSPTVNTYSLESFIAEKLDAILIRLSATSRMKDFYDLWYLAKNFKIDNTLVALAMRNTFINREHRFTSEDFEQIITFSAIHDMQKKWIAFARKNKLETSDFVTILETIHSVFVKPFTIAIGGNEISISHSLESDP